MIIFLATRHHCYTVNALINGTIGQPVPECHVLAYDALLALDHLPAATYVFMDIERLPPWERRLAAEIYRGLTQQGLRCLNDPARVLTRYPLLRALHAAGFNPFRPWRLDEGAILPRFPVFLRLEADHGKPLSDLIDTAGDLAAAIAAQQAAGVPLAGLLAVEFCAEEIVPGAWRKTGTFRIGPTVTTHHVVIEGNWNVKYGALGFATDQMFEEERHVLATNAFATAIAPAFDIAAIEWGRADHGTVGGREVVYEINTNPNVATAKPAHRSALHLGSEAIARDHFVQGLWGINTPTAAPVHLTPSERLREHRARLLTMPVFQP
jgi:hypothetical protein